MLNRLAERSRKVQQSYIRSVTRLVEAVNGINLGQGVCTFPPHPEMLQAAKKAIDDGHNSYTHFNGIASLREVIANRYGIYNQLKIGPENVLITNGATGGFESICKCFLEPGDEVIVFEPVYQYHTKLIQERCAHLRLVRLNTPDWSFTAEDIEAVITEKTKLFVFSNPHNPCGKVFTFEELKIIGDVCKRNNVIVVIDEVYEYFLSEGVKHISLASLPGMFDNTLTLSSASKTLFVTGWRIGWLTGPQDILGPLGVKSDETYICPPAPLQHAVAHAFSMGDDFFNSIKIPFQSKRDKLSHALSEAGFKPYTPEGAYYTLADYTALGFSDDLNAMNTLIEQAGIGAIPGIAFYPSCEKTGMLRFCFAVSDNLLNMACDKLVSLTQTANCK